jgi:hypothetical protein
MSAELQNVAGIRKLAAHPLIWRRLEHTQQEDPIRIAVTVVPRRAELARAGIGERRTGNGQIRIVGGISSRTGSRSLRELPA